MHDMFTLEEIAAQTKVKVKTVREWLRTGKLKGIKAGKLWRVRADDLNAFLEASVKPRIRLVDEPVTTLWTSENIAELRIFDLIDLLQRAYQTSKENLPLRLECAGKEVYLRRVEVRSISAHPVEGTRRLVLAADAGMEPSKTGKGTRRAR
jgi:excisionase family DNA binding protein